eukprot:1590338-Pleurochrysis_carterae.AAC.1
MPSEGAIARALRASDAARVQTRSKALNSADSGTPTARRDRRKRRVCGLPESWRVDIHDQDVAGSGSEAAWEVGTKRNRRRRGSRESHLRHVVL